MLDRLAGAADAKYGCGYEAAVMRGVGAKVGGGDGGGLDDDGGGPGGNGGGLDGNGGGLDGSATCCVQLANAKDALDSVDLVTWGITSASAGTWESANLTESEPYTLDPSLLHQVLDAVADAIEGIQHSCPL